MNRFDFSWDTRYRLAGLPFGIRPATAWVEVDATELRVHFGRWRLRTPLSNIDSTELSSDFAFLKTAGPPHLSFADHGITFATNGRVATCVSLREPVKGIEPSGRIRHPGITLTVADPAALEALLDPRT